MKWLALTLLACGCLLAPSGATAWALDVYVHNQIGHDGNGGFSPVSRGTSDGPVKTIAAALRRVPDGGRVILLPTPAPYRESIFINGAKVRGFKDSPLIIEGNGVELLGNVPVDPAQWNYEGGGTYRLRRPTTMTGVLFLDDQRVGIDGSATWPFPAPAPDQGALVRGNYYFNVPEGKHLGSYSLSESRLDCGVMIYRASNVIVRNLHIRGFRGDAVQVRGPVEGVRIQHSRLADCGRVGVSGYTLSDVELENCFLRGNAQAGALAENSSTLYLKSCEIAGSPQDSIQGERSQFRMAGGTPEDLKPGPFVVPPGYGQPATKQPARPEEPAAPKPESETDKAKKSFFD